MGDVLLTEAVPYLGPAWVCGGVGLPWSCVECSQAWPALLGLHGAFACGVLPAWIILSRLCLGSFPSSFGSHFLWKPSQTPRLAHRGRALPSGSRAPLLMVLSPIVILFYFYFFNGMTSFKKYFIYFILLCHHTVHH